MAFSAPLPAMALGEDSAVISSPMANPNEERPPSPGGGVNLASPTQVVEPPSVAAQLKPSRLSQYHEQDLLRLWCLLPGAFTAKKWSIFSGWCSARKILPFFCEITHILAFLQELLDSGCTLSKLKVYTVVIVAYNTPIAGQSVGKYDLEVIFLRGARRLNPPPPNTVPF